MLAKLTRAQPDATTTAYREARNRVVLSKIAGWKLHYTLLGIVLLATFLFPVYWMVITSFKSNTEVLTYPPRFVPSVWDSSAYQDQVLRNAVFLRYYLNSTIVGLGTMVLSVSLASPAAYALAHFRIRGKFLILILSLTSLFFPGIMLALPLFVIFSQLHLTNSYFGLILANTALQAQVRAGLNIALSGIPWWTTDIGGFYGGDIHSAYFQELMVRWFQYGVFSPICRLHGHRLPVLNPLPRSGADNEVWSFGDEVYEILRNLLFLRERLRPYIHQQMTVASEIGIPPMRPLFVDFPDDTVCETVDDQFMFGPNILVAPVLYEGARERQVYLPAASNWINAGTGTIHAGGQWMNVLAPLEMIPVFMRAGSDLQGIFHPR